MGVYELFKNSAPLTAKKLQGKKKQVIAAISIALLVGFLAFLPALLTGIDNTVGLGLLVIGYAVMFFFITAVGTFAVQLGIAKTLFTDYANLSPIFHWTLITLVVASTLLLMGIKLIRVVTWFNGKNIEHGTTN